MPGAETGQRKQAYFAKLLKFLDDYETILIVGADNVGSFQMQQIRADLRGKAVVLMGKNTMARKAIRGQLQTKPQLETLLPWIQGNIGFVFTNEPAGDIRKIILANKVEAPARAGAIAPNDVEVPAINTGLEPTKTSFFQALNIPTKITRGTVEILNPVQLIQEGVKVGTSEAALLQLLKIRPFKYGLGVLGVFDKGVVYEASLLDKGEDEIVQAFLAGVQNIASVSLATGFATKASVPHLLISGYKNLLSIAVATSYTFPQAQKIKDYLENPEAFASVMPAASSEQKKEEEKKPEEPAEESDEDMGLGLFD